jgi:hypothetical protein
VLQLKEFRYATRRMFKTLKSPQTSTYFPDEPRKSTVQMWRDNIRWLIKHGEANVYYFVYGLDRKAGTDEKELISWNEFRKLRNTRNQKLRTLKYNYVCLLQDKFIFGQFLKSLGFPTPPNIAIFDKTQITWLHNMKSEPVTALTNDPARQVNGFCKKLSGILGEGAFTLNVKGNKLFNKSGELSLAELCGNLDGQYLLQERIEQHPRMSSLHPPSVNTIRMVTFNNNDQVSVFSTVLRIGAHGKNVDNWASGGIIVTIDKHTGILGKEGMFKIGYGGRVTQHPDTGVVFEGFEIPFFRESIELATSLHRYFYGIHSIGWDIAITPMGPVFIEGNDDWDGVIPMALEKNFRSRFISMFPDPSLAK